MGVERVLSVFQRAGCPCVRPDANEVARRCPGSGMTDLYTAMRVLAVGSGGLVPVFRGCLYLYDNKHN